jgi:hypothetical protein
MTIQLGYALVVNGVMTEQATPEWRPLNGHPNAAEHYGPMTQAEREAEGIFPVVTTPIASAPYGITVSYVVGTNEVTMVQTAVPPPIAPPVTATTLAKALGIVTGTTSATDARTKAKALLNTKTNDRLALTDWYVSRLTETGTAIPNDVKAERAVIRAANTTGTTAITNALNTAGVVALFAPASNGAATLLNF